MSKRVAFFISLSGNDQPTHRITNLPRNAFTRTWWGCDVTQNAALWFEEEKM